MSFYIYENWRAGPRKAVIHRGRCGYCNEGRGRAGGYDPTHAKWHGPYTDLIEARRESDRLRPVLRFECKCVTSLSQPNPEK
jgi:hypothetical protein